MERTRGGLADGARGAADQVGTCPACAQPLESPLCGQCGAVAGVGPYRVLRVLRQGSRGRSYLAEGPEGRMVLRERGFSAEPSPAALQGLRHRFQQLQALAHPCIPRYLDVLLIGTGADTRAYRVQEYIEGTSLKEEFARERLSETEAQALAAEVLGILRYLQERSPSLVHGNLKPSTLIRRADGTLFLVDFALGVSEAEPSVDLSALGALLEQGLTGAGAGTPSPLPPLSPGFARFLERLSAPGRTRFASAYEAMRDLEPSAAPPRRRRSARKAALLGLGVGLAVLGAGLLLKGGSPRRGLWDGMDADALANPGPAPKTLPTFPSRSIEAGLKVPLQGAEALNPQHAPLACEWAQHGTARSAIPEPDQDPGAVLDHDLITAWRSTAQPSWLRVDLPQKVDLNGLSLTWAVTGSGRTSAEGTVETSLDGKAWEPILAVTNTAAENDVPHLFQFAPRPVQAVRFKVLLSGSDTLSVRSLELYGSGCTLPLPLPPAP
jgi:hypothetical protein